MKLSQIQGLGSCRDAFSVRDEFQLVTIRPLGAQLLADTLFRLFLLYFFAELLHPSPWEPPAPTHVNFCGLATIFPFSASLNWWSPIILTPSFSRAGCVFIFLFSSSFLSPKLPVVSVRPTRSA